MITAGCVSISLSWYLRKGITLLLLLLLLFLLLFFFSLSFLQPGRAVKWPIVKEQPVCAWDISWWFSGTLAWWMAAQKTPNNRWFACRETSSPRPNNIQPLHCLCSLLYFLIQNILLNLSKALQKQITSHLTWKMEIFFFFFKKTLRTGWNLWHSALSRLTLLT